MFVLEPYLTTEYHCLPAKDNDASLDLSGLRGVDFPEHLWSWIQYGVETTNAQKRQIACLHISKEIACMSSGNLT